jgi:hypothetical protein
LFANGRDSDSEHIGIRGSRKNYQITGIIVAANGTTLAVEKGGEKYEFAIDPATIKGSAELKVGSTVTVTYVMSVTKIESSGAPAAATSPAP